MKTVILIALTLLFTDARAQENGIYVSDAGNFNNPPWQIIKYGLDGGNPIAFITTELNWPQDILFLEDSNRVLISDLGSKITKYDATTGAYIGDFATGLSGPTRMKIGPDGSLYVLQWNGAGKVRRYQLDGTYLGEFTSVGVQQSIGIAWDVAGNLYVASYSGHVIRKFDSAGNDLGLFITTDLVGPTNIWFDAQGDLLVSDYDGGAVKRFDDTGAYISTFISGLSYIEGLAFFPNGSFLLGNGGTSAVKLFDADGTFQQDMVPSGSGGLITPNAIVIRGGEFAGTHELSRNSGGLFVHPDMGTSFQLDNARAKGMRSFSIISPEGKVVERSVKDTWNAEGAAPGIYIAIAEWVDGSREWQRIEVVH